MLRPSTQPSSRMRARNAATNGLHTVGVVAPRNPITGSGGFRRCAKADTGNTAGATAAAPSNDRNSRRRKPPGGADTNAGAEDRRWKRCTVPSPSAGLIAAYIPAGLTGSSGLPSSDQHGVLLDALGY